MDLARNIEKQHRDNFLFFKDGKKLMLKIEGWVLLLMVLL